jgi:pyrroloquinoline quinone biosynthesis protein D
MTKIDETTVLSLAPNASFQAMGEGAVILMLDSGQLYTCNETTEAFLKLIDGQRDFGAIISLLLGEFDIDREALSGDLLPIAGELRSAGVVEIRSGKS